MTPHVWTFMGDHPVLTVILALIAGSVAKAAIRLPFIMYRLRVRERNISLHGWPQPPMDADGDIIVGDQS